ncbi:YsnF/AvaK domain-containing protein [Aquimarina sp. ERC-38]|uniref:YsnF/AvaK domain-containing protein n=1 Tax=Aquimarina sp. ERC-38 TaxID=2949996 RepID=UPI0022479932|nr:YsnF/AvaK domain-containing protein [Aquimarina sp. ERC-38]UZO82058.1 YsnF/AvaK domain-containing protein [Aquimarina sp. ERC-38]
MKYTIVGFFDKNQSIENIVEILKREGINENQIDQSPYRTEGTYTGTDYDYEEDSKTSGFWDWLFGDNENEKKVYSKTGSQSHLITVYANDRIEAEKVSAILDANGAKDINDTFIDTTSSTMDHVKTNDIDETIPVIKEDIAVGKREVQTGGLQVRSRIIEKPVEETIRLKEERVYLTRKPVNRVVDAAEAFDNKTIEVKEYAEEAVVEKTARVVEEISVSKEVDQVTETISDTVRETEIDIDESGQGIGKRNSEVFRNSTTNSVFNQHRIDRAFTTAESANEYYDYLISQGYDTDDINVFLSENIKNRFYAINDHVNNTGDEALKGAGAGSAIGGTVGAVVGAIAAIGTSVIIPGLGLAVAGPLAAALTGAGAGGATGALVGALTKAGLSDSDAKVYQDALENDQIIISVDPKENDQNIYTANYGREIYNNREVSTL